MKRHAQLEATGLLGGRLDAAALAGWPAWARAHVRTCRTCRGLIAADARVRAVGSSGAGGGVAAPRAAYTAASPDGGADAAGVRAIGRVSPRPPPPSVAVLQARAAERVAGATARGTAFLSRLAAFPEGAFRDKALQFGRRLDGFEALHPSARQITVYARGDDDRWVRLASSSAESAGVHLQATWAPERRTALVALALAEAVSPELLDAWVSDIQTAGTDERLLVDSARLGVAFLTVAPASGVFPGRLRTEPHPPVDPEVQALVLQAVENARHCRYLAAARLFQRARALARERGDTANVVRAWQGLAQCLGSLGYDHVSDQVRDALLRTEALDAHTAARVCAAQGWRELRAGAFDAAARWLEVARGVYPDGALTVRSYTHALAWLGGDPSAAVAHVRDILAHHGDDAELVASMQPQLAANLLELGDVAGARAALAAGGTGASTPHDALAFRAGVEAALAWATGEDATPALGQLAAVLDCDPTERLGYVSMLLLGFLAGRAVGRPDTAAAAVLQLPYLYGPEPSGVPAVWALGFGATAFVQWPGLPAARLGVAAAAVRQGVADLRAAVILDRSTDTALDALRATLAGASAPLSGRLLVGSDGMLDGVPWQLVLAPPDPAEALPSVTEIVLRWDRRRRRPAAEGTVSFADAQGDLPLSARDCETRPDARVHTGAAATLAAFASAPPCAVLHVGLHVRRVDGLPMLCFADGALSSVDIADLRLAGAPVVLLAGCASAAAAVVRGLERSLAAAFVEAGASAVVATRWPVTDAEAHALFRRVLAEDVASDPEGVVAAVSVALRARGVPARVWAALTVYRGGAVS